MPAGVIPRLVATIGRITRRAGIISPASSSIRTVKDLIGKRVAVNRAALRSGNPSLVFAGELLELPPTT